MLFPSYLFRIMSSEVLGIKKQANNMKHLAMTIKEGYIEMLGTRCIGFDIICLSQS